MFNVSEFSFKRFISTVGIDFREKKITWRGQKNETLEKSVRTCFITFVVNKSDSSLPRDAASASNSSFGTQQARSASAV